MKIIQAYSIKLEKLWQLFKIHEKFKNTYKKFFLLFLNSQIFFKVGKAIDEVITDKKV